MNLGHRKWTQVGKCSDFLEINVAIFDNTTHSIYFKQTEHCQVSTHHGRMQLFPKKIDLFPVGTVAFWPNKKT